MKKTDGRKLSHKTLEEIRVRAVQQVESGESPEAVIKALGFDRSRIYVWLAKYREGGEAALKAKPISGRPPTMSNKQLKYLYELLATQTPEQLGFEFALWTRALIRRLIRDRFGVRMSEVSVGRMLKRMGLSPQKPMRRAYEQNEDQVRQWKEIVYPRIQALAKQEKAVIYFADEASVKSDYHAGTTWAPKGKTPVVRATGQRFGLNMLSAISGRGHLRFMVTDERLTAALFCRFLKRVLRDAVQPVFLIVDNHPVHRSGEVKRFVAATEGKLRLFHLPPYSPELNPDELVWNDLKAHAVGRRSVETKADLKRLVISHLRSLQKLPHKIMALFKEQHVRYAY